MAGSGSSSCRIHRTTQDSFCHVKISLCEGTGLGTGPFLCSFIMCAIDKTPVSFLAITATIRNTTWQIIQKTVGKMFRKKKDSFSGICNKITSKVLTDSLHPVELSVGNI